MPRLRFPAEEDIRVGEPDRVGVYVNRKNVTHYIQNLNYVDHHNDVKYVEFVITRYALASSDLTKGNRVLIMYDTTLLGSGTLRKIENTSDGYVKIYADLIGEDGIDLINTSISNRKYVNEKNDTIIKKILSKNNDGISPWTMQPSTVSSKKRITVRVDNDNKLAAIQRIAKDLGLYWYTTHSTRATYYETDRINVADFLNSTSFPQKNVVQYATTFARSNCVEILKEEDEQKMGNYIHLLGAGDGNSQLESIIYHTTTNRSRLKYGMDNWMVGDITSSGTTITGNSYIEDIWPAVSSSTTTVNAESPGTSVVVEVNSTTPFAVDDYVILVDTVNEICKVTAVNPGTSITVDKLENSFGSASTVWKCDIRVDSEYMAHSATPSSSSMTVVRDTTGRAEKHTDGSEIWQVGSSQTVYIKDNSDFPSSGNFYVGMEKVSYTGKSSTDQLTGCTRGAGWLGTVTPTRKYYAHSDEIWAWDAQYTVDSPQTGSSIDESRIKTIEKPVSTIIDQDTLDTLAGRLLDDFKDVPEIVTVIPSSNECLKELSMGDLINVSDTEISGADGDYRIEEIRVEIIESGRVRTTLVTGSSPSAFADEVSEIKSGLGNISVYPQGAPQTITINSTDNCDGTGGTKYPWEERFYIPPEAVSIEKIVVSYYLSKYRAYATTTTSQTEAGIDNSVSDYFQDVANLDNQTWTRAYEWSEVPTHGSGILIFVTLRSDEDWGMDASAVWDSYLFKCRIYRTNGATEYFPDSDGISRLFGKFQADFGGVKTEYDGPTIAVFCFYIPEDPYERDYEVQLYQQTGMDNLDFRVDVDMFVLGDHTHDPNYGISEGPASWNTTDIKIYIDDGNGYVDKTSEIENDSDLWASTPHTLNYTENSREEGMNLKKYFGDTPGWKGIKIEPDGECRIKGSIYAKYFETNR